MMTATVDNILALHATNSLSFSKKLELKEIGRDQPVFSFTGKRQCRLLDQYSKLPWLTGCSFRKSLFCFPCLIFKPSATVWSSQIGFTDLGNFTNLVKKHVCSPTHLSATTALKLLGKVRIDEAVNEGAQLSRIVYNEQVRKNREMLKHHINACVYLATQGLEFQGHNQGHGANRGNFVELVTLLGEFSANPLVGLNRAVTDFNPLFSGLSSDIQNDLILCLYEHLIDEIKRRIAAAPFLSIMADETTDISNASQMAVSVRLVHQGTVYEYLIDLVDVSDDRTADTLSALICESLKSSGITKDKMVIGQSYDGASNMAGSKNSVQVKLQNIWPHAEFVHCYAHKWALVVQSASKRMQDVSLFFGFVHNLTNFFHASPKRALLLSAALPTASSTRWLSTGKSVSTISSKFSELCDVLVRVSTTSEFDSSARAEAKGLVVQLKSIKNVFLLVMFRKVFELSDVMTKKLQSVIIHPAEVASKVSDYRKNLQDLRTELAFQEMFNQTKVFEPDMPTQTAGRKRKVNERFLTDSGYSPSEQIVVDTKTTLKATMFEVIDTLVAELDTRFVNMERLDWVKLFQPTNFDILKTDSFTVLQLVHELERYKPHLVRDKESFRNQLHVLYTDADLRAALGDAKDPASLLRKMHELDLCDALPDISNALKASVTIALTTVTCERNFSVLRRLKTYIRSTMNQDRLKHLMLLNIESGLLKELASYPTFTDDVIERFAAMKDRHLNLLYKK